MIFLRIFIGLLIIILGTAVYFNPGLLANSKRNSVGGVTYFSDDEAISLRRMDNFQGAPEISAKSAIVIDEPGGISLYEKDATVRLLPASTTKLLTALVALESCSSEQLATVTSVNPEPSSMGLAVGDVLTVESLLYGLLVASGNDAAFALADVCATSQNEFVIKMNQKAKKLGLANSHFANPAGFDDVTQYTTARDLAKLAKAAISDPMIAKIVATRSVVVNDVGGNKTYYLSNVNKLLGQVEGVIGIKTGQTDGAQENLVAKTSRGGRAIITVVLGSGDRFSESEKLIEWAFANYQWIYSFNSSLQLSLKDYVPKIFI